MKTKHNLIPTCLLAVTLLILPTVVQAQFQWAKRIASAATLPLDEPDLGLSLDASGNCYLTGFFDGTNDFGGVTLTNQSAGGSDIFVAKFDPSGALQWAQRAGGSAGSQNSGRGVGVDTNGNVYVAGCVYGPADFGGINLPASPTENFFLAKYDSTGAIQWVKQGMGYSDVNGNGLAVDGAGNSYALIFANNGDTVAFGATSVTMPSDFDANYDAGMILVKYDNTGTVQWTQVMSGFGETYSSKVAVDAGGNVYVCGSFNTSVTVGNNNLVVSPAGAAKNIFLAKFTSAGALAWVQHPSGGNPDADGGLAIDPAGNVYLPNFISSPIDFGGGVTLKNSTTYNAILSKYNSAGVIQWARAAGGAKAGFYNAYFDAALDSAGNVYAGGGLSSTAGGNNGSPVAVISKYNPAGTLQWTESATGRPASRFSSLVCRCAVDAEGNCFLAGLYEATNTFGATVLQPQGTNNIFLCKVTPGADTNLPMLTIVAPTAGQRWSNELFTVNCKVTDNVGVSNVWVAVNAGAWTAANLTNSGSNWAEQVTLNPGTNLISAYAVDTSGNNSLTKTVKVDYILSTTLTVLTNGSGTITPAYNGKTLAIGNAYSLTAKANKGFGFANWTDGLGDVITNGTTLKFIMASNLTFVANFADNTRPTLSITNPAKTGARWSNADFTISGKAGDNVVVSNVWVSLNLAAWTPATLSNHGSNWLAQVNLTPGTNSLAVYAMDLSGNFSLTNKVKVDYIVSAPMVVQIVGSGTVSPNYNGALLAISNRYTMKATAGKGFGFNYWNGGVPMTTASTLTFTMASNLSVTANFRDVTPPVASITFPTANQKWSNGVITVTGKTSDNVGVVGVGVQINHGSWVAAQMAAGNTNWSAANLPVSFGTNIIQAYAMDEAGNVSLTNMVKILGVLAPASLSGYSATLKPAVGKQQLVVTWGDDTWSQAGVGSDTNANDYCAGGYTYLQTGPNTAVLTNEDIGMLSALGTTNVTTVNLTFTSVNTANYVWTNDNESGSGTMTFSPVSNLVPATLAGKTVQIFAKTTLITTIAFANDGTFTKTNSNANYYGNYTFTQYSPTVAIIQLNHTDPNEYGAAEYLEFDFTSATAGQGFGSYYTSPIYGSNPDDFGLGTFKLK